MIFGAGLPRGLVAQRSLDDRAVESAMLTELRRIVDGSRVQTLAAGTMLLQRGALVDGIWVVLSGRVRLFLEVGVEEIVFHSETVGPVIGLLSLATGNPSYFSCRTATEVQAIALSIEELDALLLAHPDLNGLFTFVILRSLARRNRRAIELQVEIHELNRELARERDALRETLVQLKKTEMRLAQTDKLATLGQLARGIAHELNNPVAAIHRSADFLLHDIGALAAGQPAAAELQRTLNHAVGAAPLSTREERVRRAALAREAGDDEALARRLLDAGIDSVEAYRARFAGLDPEEQAGLLASLETWHQLGLAIRNIRSCAERITSLVRSVRSYARPDEGAIEATDLHVGLDDTLLLFGHELRAVEVEKAYGDLPRVVCRAGEIHQVWTNLLSNALQAMGGHGRLRVETASLPERAAVVVRVIDNGPGIAAENLDRIFEVNFTTRHGTAAFGLGIGLPICREIVSRHGGAIRVVSQPGRTCFEVELPVAGPMAAPGGEGVT